MKIAVLVDQEGNYIEDVLVEDSFINLKKKENSRTIISESVPAGLYKPYWDFNSGKWLEGMSEQDIDELNNQPIPISSDQRIKELEQQNLSLMDATASMFEQLIDIQDQLSKLSKS